jgi:hypothetical protein
MLRKCQDFKTQDFKSRVLGGNIARNFCSRVLRISSFDCCHTLHKISRFYVGPPSYCSSMTSQGSNNTPPSFNCAAGTYCQMPHVNYSSSPNKCYFCQKLLHGICGVLHDPDDITYHNHCNSCHKRFFAVSPSGQGVNPSPPVQHTATPLYPTPPSNVNTAATSIMELSSNSVLYIIPTFVLIQNADRRQIQDSIGHLFMSSLNSSGASTPIFPNGSRNATPT